jgi:uncharacterized cofD-like protein
VMCPEDSFRGWPQLPIPNRPPMNTPTVMERLALLARPGIGIKRWLALGSVGLLILASGISFAFSVSVSEAALEVARRATFARSLPPLVRGAITASLGLGVTGLSAFMLYRRMALVARYAEGRRGITESLAFDHTRSTGLKIVAIGGGTGMSTLLRGLKLQTDNLSAVVTVADDGGSSGRLRQELGIAPPGDARQCLIALSESESLMERVLSYRFPEGEGLDGHSFGNLLLAALIDIEGDLHSALQSATALLVVKGHVLPSSISTDVRLAATTVSGALLAGESAIGHSGEAIDTIWVEPPDCRANPAVLHAIAEADLIVIGPGSLYTSIIPNFLIPGIAEAVNATSAPKVLVCNVATQFGETDNLTASDHLDIFVRHSKVNVTHFLMNSTARLESDVELPPAIVPATISHAQVTVLIRDMAAVEMVTHHDHLKLARAVTGIFSR